MAYPELVRLQTSEGTAAVDPDAVVLVLSAGEQADVLLISGIRFGVSTSAQVTAERLWRYTNGSDNGYFNERHVQAVLPQGTGCRIVLAGSSSLDNEMPADMMIAAISSMNSQRAALEPTPRRGS